MNADVTRSLRNDTIKIRNQPVPLIVEENLVGMPIFVTLEQRQTVMAIENCWCIDDEWRRSEPVSWLCYRVVLNSGQRLVLCHNLVDKCWCRQSGYDASEH